MPFSRKFQNGMGFPKEDQVIDGFTVESVSVSHINISDGHYEYPTEIVVRGKGSTNKVRKTFKEFFKTKRTLFSGYGNPYQCRHGKMVVQSLGNCRFSITARGTCVRIYLRDELVRFMEYLYENKQFTDDADKSERETTIADYMKKYVRSSSRRNLFFS